MTTAQSATDTTCTRSGQAPTHAPHDGAWTYVPFAGGFVEGPVDAATAESIKTRLVQALDFAGSVGGDELALGVMLERAGVQIRCGAIVDEYVLERVSGAIWGRLCTDFDVTIVHEEVEHDDAGVELRESVEALLKPVIRRLG